MKGQKFGFRSGGARPVLKMAFTRGDNTLTVRMQLFAENRKRLCQALKAADKAEEGVFVFLKGGNEVQRYNTDASDAPFHQVRRRTFYPIYLPIREGVDWKPDHHCLEL